MGFVEMLGILDTAVCRGVLLAVYQEIFRARGNELAFEFQAIGLSLV